MRKKFKNAGILGVGLYMPQNVIKNSYWDDKEFLNLPVKKTKEECFKGISERRYFHLNMLPSDAEVEAGKRALELSGVKPDEIDLILTHSMIPDAAIPGNASVIKQKMGLENAAVWNVDTCCSSFVTMFIIASHLIACGTYKNILITTSVFHSKIIDGNDYMSPYVGDGASALVMGEVSEERGYIASEATSDGYFHDAFTIKERLPFAYSSEEDINDSKKRKLMTTNSEKTRQMGRQSIEYMDAVLTKTLEKANLKQTDLDFFFSNQPVSWAHDAWRDSLGLPKEKSHQTFNIYGNIASTSIPADMYHALEEGKLKDGDYILIASSGAGENHTAAIFRWGR